MKPKRLAMTSVTSPPVIPSAAGDDGNGDCFFVITSVSVARDEKIRRGHVQLFLQNYPKTARFGQSRSFQKASFQDRP